MNISLAPFDRDEMVIEAEHILSLLIESRCGPGSTYLHFEDCYVNRSMADTALYDLMPSGLFPFLAEAQCADSIIDRKFKAKSGMCLNFLATLSTAPAHRSPSALARGSPAAAPSRN